MQVQFKLNGVKVSKNIPSCWDEVTFRQLLAYTKAKDEVEVLSVFTEIDTETLRKSKIANLQTLLALLSFLKNQPIDYTLPKTIRGHEVSQDVEIQEIERYAALENILKTFKDGDPTNLEKYPLVVATYCCDLDKAESMSEYFMDAPAMEVLAIGHFTLLKLIGSTARIPKHSQSRSIRLKRFKLGLKTWLRNMAVMVRFYTWNGKQAITGKKS